MDKGKRPPAPNNATFIRLMNDWSFKYVFGTKEHAGILKRFLNALFEGEQVITDITFKNKELIPETKEGKKIIYDIYCTTKDKRHFIVEMQQEESENFPGRILFYVCRAIVDQGHKGVEYILDPVCCIVVADFNLSVMSPALKHDIVLMDRETGEEYSHDIRLLFLSLREVPMLWVECDTELKRQLFLIKNMEKLTKNSQPYLSGEYEEIFDACEYASLAEEDVVAYNQSYLRELDNQSAVRFASRRSYERGIEQGIERGIERGIEQGIERGRMEANMNTARTLLQMGMAVSDIERATGLSAQEIASL